MGGVDGVGVVVEERVALVTGAARGIGHATVHRLCADGLRVVALDSCEGADHDRPGVDYALGTSAQLDRLTDRWGEQVVTVTADVGDPAALVTAVDGALARWGRLDVAVGAAAVLSGGRPVWETPAEELEVLWRVDALGLLHLVAAAVPAILAGPDPSGGRVVAVASAAGDRGLFGLGGYTMVKHAAVGLVRALAADLVGTGVTAVAVSPGSTRTDMLTATAAVYDVGVDDLAGAQLLRDLLDPAEVAAAIAWCCSREGRVLNGSVLHADGGFAG